MKHTQKAERCLARLQRLIPKPGARFTSGCTEKIGDEYVEITMDFRICGAYLDGARGTIVVLVTVERFDSGDIDIGPGTVRDLISGTINSELDWMGGVKWKVSVDRSSMRKVMKARQKHDYRRSITGPVRRGELAPEEAAEVLAEILAELRPELGDVLTPGDDGPGGLIRIETRGLPCPLCLGHLSEEDIAGMYHRLRFMHMFGDDGEEDE